MHLALLGGSMTALPAPLGERQPPVRRDSLGERVVCADPVTGQLVQMLHLRPTLTSVPAFEFALRQRVARLANVSHPSCLRVGRVDRAPGDEGGLVVVSEHAAGVRLSDVLRVGAAAGGHLDVTSALAVTRQLLAAVAELHEQAPDVANGLITPERIILTSRARVVLSEQSLCAAIELLHLSADQLWRELRVGAAASPARFTERADVLNLGLVTLALVLGRPLSDQDFPGNVSTLLDAARERSTLGYERPLSWPLRNWLARALQLDEHHSFATVQEARALFERIVAADPLYLSSPLVLEILYETCARILDTVPDWDAPSSGAAAPAAEQPVTQPARPDDASTALPPSVAPQFLKDHEIFAEMLPPSPVSSDAGEWRAPSEAFQTTYAYETATNLAEAGAIPRAWRGFRWRVPPPAWRVAGIAATLIGLLAGGVALTRSLTPSIASASEWESAIHAVQKTPAQSAAVHLATEPATPSPAVDGTASSSSAGATERTGDAGSSSTLSPVATVPAPKPAWGWLSVKSSSPVNVYADGRRIGTSTAERIRLAPGEHEIEFVDEALAFRTLRIVPIVAAKVTNVSVSVPATGLVHVNASPWADVWIGSRHIGETPLANVSVPVGRHEVVFRHPHLGEKRQWIVVTAGEAVRVSVEMR